MKAIIYFFHRSFKLLLSMIVPVIFLLSLLIMYHQLKAHTFSDIAGSLRMIAPWKLALSCAVTGVNYLVVCTFDVLAFRYLRVRLDIRKILHTAFIGNAISNVAGYAMLSGGAVKYRLYARYNVPLSTVAEAVFFSSMMLWIGLFTVGGLMVVAVPSNAAYALHLPPVYVRIGGAAILTLICGYILTAFIRKKPVKAGSVRIHVPSPSIAVMQVFLSSADWLFAALALYILLPRSSVSFFTFLAVYLPAQLLAILSQVPGGFGIFESIVLLIFPRTHTRPEVLAALLSFRIIYYLLPFSVAMVTMMFGRLRKQFQ